MTQRSESQLKISKKDFVPSMKTLHSIFKILLDNGSETKTGLSLYANLNYSRLSKHTDWMVEKGLVESIFKDGRESIKITDSGRNFATLVLG